MMILKYYGHACFTLSYENGTVVVCDPYGEFYAYPKRSIRADVCLVSHHHFDHDSVASLQPGAQVIDTIGRHTPLRGLTINGISTWHDDKQGALRGPNIMYVVEAEGLRIVHAGDLGHVPTAEQVQELGHIDVLLLPVGGYYTIDAPTALDVCRLLQPTTTIPMHYRTCFDEEMPIAPVGDFLALCEAEDTQMPLVRITKDDATERPNVFTLAIQPEGA